MVYCYVARGELMLLTIDVGNSNTVFVVYDGLKEIYSTRMITKKEDSVSYYENALSVLEMSINDVVLSSVVPGITAEVEQAVLQSLNLNTKTLSGATIKDFKINLDEPLEIGADFIATSIAASAKYDEPIIIADIGSATKLTLTSAPNVFDGGIILPGLGTSLKALTSFIPHLPEVPLVVPESVVGHSTISAIQSGVMYGLIAQVEGLAKRMEDEIGRPCVKIITGGYAAIIHTYLPEFNYEPSLLNEGLQIIHQKGLIK